MKVLTLWSVFHTMGTKGLWSKCHRLRSTTP